MPYICPKTVNVNPGGSLPLNHESMPRLRQIIIDENNKNAVKFKVLACITENPKLCNLYTNPNANIKLCQANNKLAHIYYSEQSQNASVKHYLFMFVRISEDKNAVMKSLSDSIIQLGINTSVEKTYFNIVIYDFSGTTITYLLIKEYEKYLNQFTACDFKILPFNKGNGCLTIYDPNNLNIDPLTLI
jgi:hypothetical protein